MQIKMISGRSFNKVRILYLLLIGFMILLIYEKEAAMKAVIKNILIIVELILIIFLSVVVYFLYQKNNEAVTTMGAGSISTDQYEDIDRKVNENYYELSGKKILLEDGTYGEIWIPVLENVPAFSKEIDQIKTRNGRKYYLDGSDITSLLGVDVSVHQENIDWQKVKESGIDFAMIRLGYRGYGSGEAGLDENYAETWHENNHGKARAFFEWVNQLEKDLLLPIETGELKNYKFLVENSLRSDISSSFFDSLKLNSNGNRVITAPTPTINATNPINKPWLE